MKYIKNLISIPILLIILACGIILSPLNWVLYKISDKAGKVLTGTLIWFVRVINKFRK
jgi:hypothetical protein